MIGRAIRLAFWNAVVDALLAAARFADGLRQRALLRLWAAEDGGATEEDRRG